MSQTGHRDLEGGDPADGHSNRRHSTPDQSLQPLDEEPGYSDSAWPLYSIYTNIADDEDSKMVERCQNDTDGTLIFTGLFSATVGALLTISIQDLKPNSQDTSAFYLKNIYQLFGNPNVSQPSITSTFAEPPAFSPPRYAIWVNSLWFLSLIVSVSAALVATLFRDWAVQYISVTQQPWYTPDKRARVRAIFAKGNPGPYCFWGTGLEPFYLHFSVLLFIAGSLVYLFNINRAVFYAVVWWIGYMAFKYAAYSHGFFEPHDLLHTPLSDLALRIYLHISYVFLQVCSCIPLLHSLHNIMWTHYSDLSDRYNKGFLNGKRRAVEEIASKPSSEIDALILERILLRLDGDRAMKTFFDAIPGFCSSKLCVLPLSIPVRWKLKQALNGFLDRTFSSNLASESVRASRFITCLNAAYAALGPDVVSGILDDIFVGNWDESLQFIEIGYALSRWGHGWDHGLNIRRIVARIIARTQRRDDRWVMLVKESFGVPDGVLQDSLAHGDSALLSILIHISHQTNRAGSWTSGILSSLSRFDIHNTLPGLQNDFCMLWNEIAKEARTQGSFSIPAQILHEIHHLYVALHKGTDAAPTAFSASATSLDPILEQPLSFPLCDIASHRPDSTIHIPVPNFCAVPLLTNPGDPLDASPHQFTVDCSTALQLAEETNTFTGLPSPPPDPLTTSNFGETPQDSTATFPVPSSPPSSDRSRQDGAATAQPDATSTTTLSRPLKSSKQGDVAIPCAVPLAEIDKILFTLPTPLPTPVPVPASTPPILDESISAYDASHASMSKPLHPASSSDFSAPGSFPPPPVPPAPNAEPLSLLGGTSPEDPSDDSTQPRLHPRRLVNNGNMCLENAVPRLLVYYPPFRDLFRDMGQLMGQREGKETDGGATPLMDATVRFLDEFAYKEKSSLTQQDLQQTPRGKAREGDADKEDDMDPLIPTYMYDAMKKRQFVSMKDGKQQDAKDIFGLYLEALDEEFLALRASMSIQEPVSTLEVDDPEEEIQSGEGQTRVGERDSSASSVKSPISCVFAGRSRSTVQAPNQPDTVTVEDWRSLQLNIQPDSIHTVEDALAHISQPQPAQVGQLSSSEASQRVQIEALPSVLVLHLKRFLHDAEAGNVVKISKPIQFAPELEVPLEIMTQVAGKIAEPVHYKLYGVLYHHGAESAGNGHYTADVFHPNRDGASGGGWLHIDDEAVREVGHDDVFGGHDNEGENDRCAYMLFYCRTASA